MSVARTVQDTLARHGIEMELVPHPRTYTTHDAAVSAHVPEDHIAKAVIVKDAEGYAMAVIPGSHWLKLDALQKETDRRFEVAEEPEAEALFPDCKPGAMPPLGPAYELETFLDDQLSSLANVYFEAGDHEHLVHVDGEAFHELLKGVRHGYFSHNH